MCTANAITFGALHLSPSEVEGKSIIEVGSCNVNGSLRPLLESWHPREYVGVDIAPGRGVDEICDVENVVCEFGESRFDIVVATEVIEHVRDWRKTLSNLKGVCRAGGTVLVTTRSKGFPHHAYPHDFWRYELSDMRHLFSDCTVVVLEDDPHAPGVMLKATKPADFSEADLLDHELYCTFLERKVRDLGDDRTTARQMRRFAIRQELRRLKSTLIQTPRRVLELIVSR
jgi:SAM-dependent methyltransferase